MAHNPPRTYPTTRPMNQRSDGRNNLSRPCTFLFHSVSFLGWVCVPVTLISRFFFPIHLLFPNCPINFISSRLPFPCFTRFLASVQDDADTKCKNKPPVQLQPILCLQAARDLPAPRFSSRSRKVWRVTRRSGECRSSVGSRRRRQVRVGARRWFQGWSGLIRVPEKGRGSEGEALRIKRTSDSNGC